MTTKLKHLEPEPATTSNASRKPVGRLVHLKREITLEAMSTSSPSRAARRTRLYTLGASPIGITTQIPGAGLYRLSTILSIGKRPDKGSPMELRGHRPRLALIA